MARILVGVSGGIAAYKALDLVRLATKAGHAVRVVQTANHRTELAAELGADAVVAEIAAMSGRAWAVQGDVASPEGCQALIDAAVAPLMATRRKA